MMQSPAHEELLVKQYTQGTSLTSIQSTASTVTSTTWGMGLVAIVALVNLQNLQASYYDLWDWLKNKEYKVKVDTQDPLIPRVRSTASYIKDWHSWIIYKKA